MIAVNVVSVVQVSMNRCAIPRAKLPPNLLIVPAIMYHFL